MGGDPWGDGGSKIQRLGIHGSREFMVGHPWTGGVYRDPKWDPLQGSCRAPWREDGKGGPSTGVREKILRDLEEGYRYRSRGRASAGRCVQELGIHVGSGEIQVHPEWVRIHGEEIQSRGSGRVRSSKGIRGGQRENPWRGIRGRREWGWKGPGSIRNSLGGVRGGSGGCLGEDNTRIHVEGMIEG